MERLQKVIAHAGFASRRKAEEMILKEGKGKWESSERIRVKVSSSDKWKWDSS